MASPEGDMRNFQATVRQRVSIHASKRLVGGSESERHAVALHQGPRIHRREFEQNDPT